MYRRPTTTLINRFFCPPIMNTALILAGGTGQRVGADIPKQFLKIQDTPIIAYTLSVFQAHEDIDRIAVVCVDGWKDEVLRCKEEFGIDKLYRIVPGGSNSMGSISNGIDAVAEDCGPEDIVVIHDSVRPLIDREIISDCIRVCKRNGNGCASIDMQETVIRTSDGISGNVNIDRSDIKRVQTPQAYRVGPVKELYDRAHAQGITESIYTNTLLVEMGGTVFFSKGSTLNVKITTAHDLDVFEALLNVRSSKPMRRPSSEGRPSTTSLASNPSPSLC